MGPQNHVNGNMFYCGDASFHMTHLIEFKLEIITCCDGSESSEKKQKKQNISCRGEIQLASIHLISCK